MVDKNNLALSIPTDKRPETTLTDRQLFEKFREFGRQALEARNKCIGMLPEINRRRLYERHGYLSIYEFAARLAGLSHEQVNRVLNLEPRLQDKPALQQALISGAVSINKLRKVISIVTVENQAEVAETVRTLSVRAVECLVKDHKLATAAVEAHPGDIDTIMGGHVTTQKNMNSEELQLEPEVQKQLLDMQKKGLDINILLKEFLRNHQTKIEAEKQQIAKNLPVQPASRYVPVRVQAVLNKEYGRGCSIPGCRKPAESLHHTRRFALVQNHDPRFLAPLCRGHHELAHHLDAKVLMHRLGS